tara:strand:+ start:14663 stop:16198 length:1536 start_codon:yes stop_codon:yes gene_type:complete
MIEKIAFAREPVALTFFFLCIFITMIFGASLLLNISSVHKGTKTLAIAEARANWNKNLAFRGWATRHGGLYVVPDERTPPNPYLSHVPDRDVVTTDGKKLTLMNPSYMMRQMIEEYEDIYGIRGSITGKVLLNPVNKADEWELRALDQFELGVDEVIGEEEIDGKPFIRLMKPVIMEKKCEKCHGHLGFREGDIRGGVSVSIPLAPYTVAAGTTIRTLTAVHFILWFAAILAILRFSWFARKRDKERVLLQNKLRVHQENLEETIEGRTAQLEAAQEQLVRKERLAIVGQLAATVSHELRNPLGTIQNSLFILKEKTDNKSASMKKIMGRLERNVIRCNNIIEELLDFTQVQSLHLTTTAINELLHSILKEYNFPEEITLRQNLTSEAKIPIGQDRFRRAVINVIDNACQAMKEGQGPEQREMILTVETRNVGERLEVSFEDNGPGISGDIYKHIFEPLFSSKSFGIGLGLTIVKQIMEQHGGGVEIKSAKGTGTDVILWLPLKGTVIGKQ